MRNSAHSSTLGILLQRFFTIYLQDQRNVSPCTVAAYRDTFRLLFSFAEQHVGRRPAELILTDINASLVLSFLAYLEETRRNTVRTRNSRLAAIRSFMHYVSLKEPEAVAACAQILAIPVKRHERPMIGFISRVEMQEILQAPDQASWSGRRDCALFSTMYNTGARVSELINMRVSDACLSPSASIRIRGKGRKLRAVPIWSRTAVQLRQWLEFCGNSADQPLFPNRRGGHLSRTGISERLILATRNAAQSCGSLRNRRVTPHVIRHSTAMHLLQSGVDITVIALWLGHESPVTTHGYIEADLEMKERAMKALAPAGKRPVRFEPGDELMQFLDSL